MCIRDRSRGIGSQYYSYDFVVERNGQTVELNDVKFASRSYAKMISEYKKLVGGMHIKLDTGMSRLGFGINEQSVETIKRIIGQHNL